MKDFFWAKELVAHSINSKDVRWDRETGHLYLKHLDLRIGKQHSYILEEYYSALELVDQRSAKFRYDEQGDLYIIDVAGLQVSIQTANDLLTLKELLVDGIYNFQFSHPTVVLDIRMDVGISSLFFASFPKVLVVGYEPCNKKFDQALLNFSLNPTLSKKIQSISKDIGDARFKSIAMYPPKKIGLLRQSGIHKNRGMGPIFEYDEVEIEDIAEILDSIASRYPEHNIVVKIDYGYSGYHIGGISEDQIIHKLLITNKLALINAILLKWYKPKPVNDPPEIARQLSNYGLNVLLFSPTHPFEGILYAFKYYTQNQH